MAQEQLPLAGKVAIVTGGGKGLGKAMALALAEAGADVAVGARTQSDIDAVAVSIRSLGRRAIAVPTDVTQSAQIDNLVQRTIAELGQVDVLINNAGGGAPGKPIWEITDEEWLYGLNLNLSSTFWGARAVLQHMTERKSGKIINLSSGWGYRGNRFAFMYCSTKAGIINLTRTLAITYAEDNIQVNCIAPGSFPHLERLPEERREALVARGSRQPMGRFGEDEEIGQAAVFLASAASDYLTGQTVLVDGGAIPAAYAPTGFTLSLTS